MARLFDDGASDYLQIDQAGVTVPPFSMVCWFNVDVSNLEFFLIQIADKDVADQYHALWLDGLDASDYVGAATYDGTWKEAKTTAGFSTGTWMHAAGVWADTDDRRVYLNGGNKGTETTSVTPANMDRMTIGASGDSTPEAYISGHMAEVAIWNVALIDAEVVSLAKGFSPLFIRPQNLVAYWPLIRGLNDRVGGYNMTASGTVISAHPRIIYPTSGRS